MKQYQIRWYSNFHYKKEKKKSLAKFRESRLLLIQLSSSNRRRSLAAKEPVGSRAASARRLCLIWFRRFLRPSCSSLSAAVSSWRSWSRYFCPNDRKLSSKIPVITKNWMKLSFLLMALAINPSDFFGVLTPPAAAEPGGGGAEVMAAKPNSLEPQLVPI